MKKYFMPISLLLIMVGTVIEIIWVYTGYKYLSGEPLSPFALSMTQLGVLGVVLIVAFILFVVGMTRPTEKKSDDS